MPQTLVWGARNLPINTLSFNLWRKGLPVLAEERPELAAPKHVNMQVVYGLAAIAVAVYLEPISLLA